MEPPAAAAPARPRVQQAPLPLPPPTDVLGAHATDDQDRKVWTPEVRCARARARQASDGPGHWWRRGQEDQLVMELVEKYGQKRWAHIGHNVPGRTGKQCRERWARRCGTAALAPGVMQVAPGRWHNHLNPKISRDKWTVQARAAVHQRGTPA
jgi:hypothetical protein